MPKKKNPAHEAEDKLFANARPETKALMKEHRKLKRAQQRAQYWKERGE
jgi:hypothetical protein